MHTRAHTHTRARIYIRTSIHTRARTDIYIKKERGREKKDIDKNKISLSFLHAPNADLK